MGIRYNSILDTIGNTPTVRINNLGPEHVNIYVKVESFYPMNPNRKWPRWQKKKS